MTIELALCLILAIGSYPLSKSISMHYALFAGVNGAMLGYTEFDSSLLAIVFMCLAVTDGALFVAGGRAILLLSAAASMALCLESILNIDWLLRHSTYLNAIVNAMIVASLIKGKRQWTNGR